MKYWNVEKELTNKTRNKYSNELGIFTLKNEYSVDKDFSNMYVSISRVDNSIYLNFEHYQDDIVPYPIEAVAELVALYNEHKEELA